MTLPLGDLSFLSSMVVVGAVLLVLGVAKLRVLWKTLRIDEVSPADVTAGPVLVEGTATESDGTVVAPLTGAECLAYRVRVREHGIGGSPDIESLEDGVPFLVRDPAGAVRVDPEGAGLNLEGKQAATLERDDEPTDDLQRVLDRTDVDHDPGGIDWGVLDVGTRPYEDIAEFRLDPDETTAVLGIADEGPPGVTRPTVEAVDHWWGLFDRVLGFPFVVTDGDDPMPSRSRLAIEGVVLTTFGLLSTVNPAIEIARLLLAASA